MGSLINGNYISVQLLIPGHATGTNPDLNENTPKLTITLSGGSADIDLTYLCNGAASCTFTFRVQEDGTYSLVVKYAVGTLSTASD